MGRTYGRKGNSRSKSCENGKMIQISTYLLKFADTAIKKREGWGKFGSESRSEESGRSCLK
jgi:hypothetical protein